MMGMTQSPGNALEAALLGLVLAACPAFCWADSSEHYMLWSAETPHSGASIEYYDYSGCLAGQCIPNARSGYDCFDAQGMFVGSTRCPTHDRIDYYDIAGRLIKSITTGPLGNAALYGQYGPEFFLAPTSYLGNPEALDHLVLDPLEVKEND